ncbi:hypothetical protein ACFQ9Z_38620 [Streptomyces sp. NPDC056580]|uniref:hypothetical protein n=1 Tax=Streptomyces sp. NPDC056580 TaxID=3345872 RepID=UPI00368CDF54
MAHQPALQRDCQGERPLPLSLLRTPRARRHARLARDPADGEPLDPAWRPIDLTRDSFEDWAVEDRVPWPDDHSVLCWWLPTFWRWDHSAS